jgi:dTDP-4-amino-4,6-dideoxygalactose transaminase
VRAAGGGDRAGLKYNLADINAALALVQLEN